MRLSSHPSQPIHFISNIFVPLHRGFQQHPSLLWQRALLSSGLEANSLGAPDKLSNLSATLTSFNFQTLLPPPFVATPLQPPPKHKHTIVPSPHLGMVTNPPAPRSLLCALLLPAALPGLVSGDCTCQEEMPVPLADSGSLATILTPMR